MARRGHRRLGSRRRRGRHRALAPPPRALPRPAPPGRVRRGGAAVRQPDARPRALPGRAPALERPLRSAGRRHCRHGRERLAWQGRRRPEARRNGPLRPPLDRRARLRPRDHDALRRRGAARARRAGEPDLPLDGAQHALRPRPLRSLPARPDARLPRRPRLPLRRAGAAAGGARAVKRRPKLAVWKFASCDGCQLSLLDCEDELLTLAGEVEIAYFPEASRMMVKGPYDLSLVEGSITTPHDAERIKQVRQASKYLVTIGACATAGGIQALRNFKDVKQFISVVYASPQYIDALATSTPISN